MTENNSIPKYYVVAILSNTELIINAGNKDGINEDDYFDILEGDKSKKAELHDPITNGVIDEFSKRKQRVYVKTIKENYCICTSQYSEPFSSQLYPTMISNGGLKHTIGQPMKVDESEFSDFASKFSYSTIHVKDEAALASR